MTDNLPPRPATFDNEQQIFDFVVESVVRQGRPSKSGPDSLSCAYRGYGWTKCAVGHLILDKIYKPKMEGYHVKAAIIQDALALSGIPLSVMDGGLLKALQRAHDNASAYSDSEFVPGFLSKAAMAGFTRGMDISICYRLEKELCIS